MTRPLRIAKREHSDEQVDGRRARCLRGRVSLENNGGFLQLSLDLSRDGLLDVSAYDGIRLFARGNGERYNLHLKTADTTRPWQSYRSSFETGPEWQDILLPFSRDSRISTSSVSA